LTRFEAGLWSMSPVAGRIRLLLQAREFGSRFDPSLLTRDRNQMVVGCLLGVAVSTAGLVTAAALLSCILVWYAICEGKNPGSSFPHCGNCCTQLDSVSDAKAIACGGRHTVCLTGVEFEFISFSVLFAILCSRIWPRSQRHLRMGQQRRARTRYRRCSRCAQPNTNRRGRVLSGMALNANQLLV
jgi:hypothetical protein